MPKRPGPPLLFAAVLLAVTALVAASEFVDVIYSRGGPADGFEYAVASVVLPGTPFTIESRFEYAGARAAGGVAADATGGPALWLAGVATARDGAPDALALTWALDSSGWFPVWKLRLESRLGLLPESLVDRRDGELAIIDLADLRPQAGHAYRTGMAYDPDSRTIAILVEDESAGAVAYAAHLKLAAALDAGPLYPAAGWSVPGALEAPASGETREMTASPASQVPASQVQDVTAPAQATAPPASQASASPVKLAAFSVTEGFRLQGLPLAMERRFRSELLEVPQQVGDLRRKVGMEYLAGDVVGVRIEWPAEPVDGEVRLLLGAGGGERALATLSWQEGPQEILFNPGAFPLGESLLVLEYADEEHRAQIAQHPLRIIEAKVQANYAMWGQDYDRGEIVGALHLAPDLGAVSDADLVLEATFTPEGDSGPPETSVVLRRRIESLDGPVSLPFAVPSTRTGTLLLQARFESRHVAVAGASRRLVVRGGDVVTDDPTLFPFVVNPWQESPDNITNVSHWLERPAGRDGFIRVEHGHFVAGDGSPVRFLGVNCAFSGCFPDRASAERIARQLARFGINLVRFHHMDMQEAPGGIWRRGTFPRELDPVQLDRLDYFIYQLKENGIYSNLNLHVSRTMTPQEGFPEPGRPDFDKGLSYFEPGIIERHKEYARALLTHTNPYTGNRYVEEPAVAMIEITNENGLILFTQWGWIDSLPERYRDTLDARWQAWLSERYGTTEALRAAWGGGDAGPATELAANGRLEAGIARWSLETDADSRAEMLVVPQAGPVAAAQAFDAVKGSVLAEESDPIGEPALAKASAPVEAPDPVDASGAAATGPAPPPALEVRVLQKGAVSWRPQFYHVGLGLRPGRVYNVSFWLKADRTRSVSANLMMHHDPWSGFGTFDLQATAEWRRFEFTVRVPASATVREGRVSFTNLESGATYWVAGLSVQELQGDGEGLPSGESLETKVSRPEWRSLGTRSSRVQRDYVAFLWDVERAYFDDMYRFIKEELGARAPVTGTQVQWSPPGVQAALDYVDVHAYWNHPEFPGASWDASNWYVRNNSMVDSPTGGNVATLAGVRVAGKPYVVSEYNHPAPITFGSEAFLLTGAYGAFQEWDGLVAFAWSHDADFWPQRIPSFFDIKSHPTKLATLPAVAALFLRGDVRPGERLVLAPLPDEVQLNRLLETTVMGVGSGDGGVPPLVALQHRVALDVEAGGGDGAASEPVTLPGPTATSDTGELRWERAGSGRSVVTVDAARSKAVIGYGSGRTFDLSGVTVTPGPTRQEGWSAITLTVMEGLDFMSPGRILVTATGYAENTGMGWERLSGDMVTVRNRWGTAPSLVEGIPARIELPVPPERVTAYALDGAGYRREPVAVQASDADPGRTLVEIGPEYRTLWYEIDVADP